MAVESGHFSEGPTEPTPDLLIINGPDLEMLITALTLRLRGRGRREQIYPEFTFVISAQLGREIKDRAAITMIGETAVSPMIELGIELKANHLRFGLFRGEYNTHYRRGILNLAG